MSYDPEQILDQVYRGENRRFTQDTPVLYEVWAKYLAAEPKTDPIQLLLTPFEDPSSPEASAGRLAVALRNRLRERWGDKSEVVKNSKIAYHQSAVVATLGFRDMVQIILPMSNWWNERILGNPGTDVVHREGAPKYNLLAEIEEPAALELLAEALCKADRAAGMPQEDPKAKKKIPIEAIWLVRVVGLISLYLSDSDSGTKAAKMERSAQSRSRRATALSKEDAKKVVDAAAQELKGVVSYRYINDDGLTHPPLVFAVNWNHEGTESVFVSSRTVKSDAVDRLFGVDCKAICWAVVDSGIDAYHPAFRRRGINVRTDRKQKPKTGRAGKPQKKEDLPAPREESFPDPFEEVKEDGHLRWLNHTRIAATYDFTRIRDLMRPGLKLGEPESLPPWLQERVERFKDPDLERQLKIISDCLDAGRMIEWSLLGEILRVRHDKTYVAPVRSHGTHVAGIIGADWRIEDDCPIMGGLRGLCPSIQLYDLRVIRPDGTTDSFTVMAALQFARGLNTHSEVRAIHGINLSLSIPQIVRSFACGRSPVCDEAERLVGSGVVVVAAAGNSGHKAQEFGGEASLDDVFQSITITDPGNAESVITVGATHREKPHQYGVSYFSSRGPTADGRVKPDLVAPGEKIQSTVPDAGIASMDGTSQAAPHVSGAAAILMARHNELIGRPAEIKRILCSSATDLGRYRFFQGHGLLDILRALQSV